jgi:cellular nucleic acid-binding protein
VNLLETLFGPGGKGRIDVQCYKCQEFGHMAANCNAEVGKGKKGKGKGMQCYTCNGFGHKSSDCTLREPRGFKRKAGY